MTKTLTLLPFLVLSSATALAQSEPALEREVEAVRQVALDYLVGAESADAARMERALHPEVTKVLLARYRQTGAPYLRKSGVSQLVEVTRARGAFVEEEKRHAEVTVYDIGYDMASVKVVSTQFVDHLLLAKIDGQWKIVDVLWVPNGRVTGPEPTPVDIELDKRAVKSTALDYIQGAYEGNAERMASALHPELTKVLCVRHPQTGKHLLLKTGASQLIEGTRAKLGLLGEDERNIEITVFDVGHDLASARIVSAMYIDYLQLAKLDGNWQIINVLWVPNPGERRG
ncbi:MAG: hypothetical protein GTN78_22125 [Gemmatimonadales bacterium]|nr:hypothetical protein [Gemmatimonadales bacterium]NIN10856.1 hypothetical protein [Gemmatimonadales bacterium]NIR02864.1 hypothetical protein [Gemmatimonadales bacterium]NIS66498.1 hypothetical protein [Gemmatimonadales bacterium]